MISVTGAQIELWLAAFLWPFVRVLALFTVAPVLSHRALPVRTRVGLALLVTVLVAPTLPAAPAVPLISGSGLMLLAQQLLVGFAIGFAMRIVFAAVDLAGDLIGLQMGLSYALFFDPQTSMQTPLVGNFLGMVALLLFLALDGPSILLFSVADSFHYAPVGPDFHSALRWELLPQFGAQLFALGLQISLPVLATMLLCNISLGVMARAAPQLNLFSVGFPVTLLSGLTLLALMIVYMGRPIEAALQAGLRLFQ